MTSPNDDDIVVKIIKRTDRKCFIFRWHDSVTDEGGDASSGVPKKAGRSRAAEAVPAFKDKKRAERPASKGSWDDFVTRINDEVAPDWRESTRKTWRNACRQFTDLVQPKLLADVDHSAISTFRKKLRERKAEPSTIDSYLRQMRSALNEGALLFPGYSPPKIKTGKHDPAGRPLTREEFKHLLAFVPKELVQHKPGQQISAERKQREKLMVLSMCRLLHGLVWSALRISQAVDLSWEIDAPIHVENLDGPRPMIVITKRAHKGKRNQRVPIMPPLVTILRRIPERKRQGRVFTIWTLRGQITDANTIGKMISRIGVRSGIETGTRIKRFKKDHFGSDGKILHRKGDAIETIRYASCHDLKRTCVTWLHDMGMSMAEIAMIAQHGSIDTTFASYLQKDAECLSDRAHEVFAKAQKKRAKMPRS